MPSGKRSKQQRREGAAAVRTPPPVRSKGLGGPRGVRQASPRALAIGGGVVALAVVAVVLGLVFAGGRGSSTGIPEGTPTIGSAGGNALPGAQEAAALFKGIPQNGLTLGSPSAPVEMTMFIDLQCPVCQNFELNAMPTLVRKYVRPGKVRIDLKPWAFIGNDSVRGQAATDAASLQNKAFTFAEVLYINQGEENTGWLTDAMIAQIAASVPGLNVPKLFADRDTARVKTMQDDVDALANAMSVNGTPTIFVAKKGGTPQDVAPPGAAPTLQQVETAIDAALAA